MQSQQDLFGGKPWLLTLGTGEGRYTVEHSVQDPMDALSVCFLKHWQQKQNAAGSVLRRAETREPAPSPPIPGHRSQHGEQQGAAALESSKELSYSSKDPCTSQTLLVTVVRNPVFLRDVGKVILENYRALLIPFPVLFQNWVLPRFYWALICGSQTTGHVGGDVGAQWPVHILASYHKLKSMYK